MGSVQLAFFLAVRVAIGVTQYKTTCTVFWGKSKKLTRAGEQAVLIITVNRIFGFIVII